MTAPELKPCPFCGGEASISKDHDPDGNGAFYAVKCRKCRAKSPEIYAVETCNIHFTQVRDAWNRRADLATFQPAQVRVKPLVWEEPCYTNNWIHVARSVFGDYYISIDGGRHSAWLEANVKPYENKIGDEVGSVIEAMMLAETDYQARMQPLITPQPDPRDEVIARLVEALNREPTLIWIIENTSQVRIRDLAIDMLEQQRAAISAAKAVQHD